MADILVVDDERNMRKLIKDILVRDGHAITTVASGEKALKAAAKQQFDLVVLDLKLPGIDGIETLQRLRPQRDAAAPDVIIITAHATVDAAVEALRAGAIDFLIKPFEPSVLRDTVQRALSESEAFDRTAATVPVLDPKQFVLPDDLKKIASEDSAPSIVGRSKELRQLLTRVQQVAGTDATVLITGETGTGKELVARAVHLSSHRREGPFVSINCAALPDTLVENELFGHERGAYTDASTRQIGKVAQADGGTLLLDEVGDLASSAQAKLLRLIEEHEYIPLGGTKTIKADVRIVAATNRDLAEMVTAELFREDLYWRLRVIPIHIPPLRKRGHADIKDLANHFMNEFSKKYKKPKRQFTSKQLKSMSNYPWPGNVRELRSFVERYLLLGDKSLPQTLPDTYSPPASIKQPPTSPKASGATEHLLDTAKQKGQQAERDAIIDAIKRAGGNKKTAAEILGISYRSLFYKLEKYNITTEISAR